MISTDLLHLSELLLLLSSRHLALDVCHEKDAKNIHCFILVECHLGLFRKLRGC